MVLYPIFSTGGTQASALGVFKAHSTYDTAKSEGGRLAKLVAEGTELKVSNDVAAAEDASTIMHCLVDEQGGATSYETSVGSFLPASQAPIVLGPATHLHSGRVSVWQESGYFLTSEYDLAVDAYGEATLALGSVMKHTSGKLNDTGTGLTRVHFMQMVDDATDLFSTLVSPPPATGMFGEKPLILVYQTK